MLRREVGTEIRFNSLAATMLWVLVVVLMVLVCRISIDVSSYNDKHRYLMKTIQEFEQTVYRQNSIK